MAVHTYVKLPLLGRCDRCALYAREFTCWVCGDPLTPSNGPTIKGGGMTVRRPPGVRG